MRIALLGATGRTGRLVLTAAVAHGHQVTALARNPESLVSLRSADVTLVEGDVHDAETLARVIKGADAVISAVGARGRNQELHTILARNTITAMITTGASRFVGVSVGGLDVPGDQKGPRDRFIGALARTFAGAASADRKREYQAWHSSGLQWTLIRVPRLERDLIRERTNAGLQAARARERSGGRPALLTKDKLRTARRLYEQQEMTVEKIGEVLGVSRATVYRALRREPAPAAPRRRR